MILLFWANGSQTVHAWILSGQVMGSCSGLVLSTQRKRACVYESTFLPCKLRNMLKIVEGMTFSRYLSQTDIWKWSSDIKKDINNNNNNNNNQIIFKHKFLGGLKFNFPVVATPFLHHISLQFNTFAESSLQENRKDWIIVSVEEYISILCILSEVWFSAGKFCVNPGWQVAVIKKLRWSNAFIPIRSSNTWKIPVLSSSTSTSTSW